VSERRKNTTQRGTGLHNTIERRITQQDSAIQHSTKLYSARTRHLTGTVGLPLLALRPSLRRHRYHDSSHTPLDLRVVSVSRVRV
jgi:hypothetical protein